MMTGVLSMTIKVRATIEDLYALPDVKAEIVNGEVVTLPPTGAAPGYAATEVFVSLREYGRRTKTGIALSGNAAFHVSLPNRESFSPDAAFYTGQWTGMKFCEGAPIFAVEVRGEEDSGAPAEAQMAKKRLDYFAAGTIVVWDVDLLSDEVVKSYSTLDPNVPRVFRRGDTADAEPAVPSWSFAVNDLFDKQ